MFPVQERVVASEPPDLLGMSTGYTSVGTTRGTGNTVNVANGIGHPRSISSARSVPAAFSYIRTPEVPSFAVNPNQQSTFHTPDVGLVGIQPNPWLNTTAV